MQKIQGLFDKVVSDVSVIKFLQDPWTTLKLLLVKEPDAELIAEASTACDISTYSKETYYWPAQASVIIPFTEWKDQDIKKQRSKTLLNKIQELLLKNFHEVKLMKGFYPYRDEDLQRQLKTKYWIARHPKDIMVYN